MPSTVIKTFTYDPVHKTLEVYFLSGKKYHYLDVPEEVYLQMKAAFSKGIFFNEQVKPFFECIKTEGGGPAARVPLFPDDQPD